MQASWLRLPELYAQLTNARFVMGGWDNSRRKTLDDMYILSLPGFHWFKVAATSGSGRA